MNKKLIKIIIGILISTSIFAQEYTISGYLRDGNTGEELISATAYVQESKVGTESNEYGFYSITLPKGKYTLLISYLGYADKEQVVNLSEDKRIDIELGVAENVISEITISSKAKDENVRSSDMSRVSVDIETVKKMPALFGEVDIIKSIQLIPGVKALGEGSSGFYVRGGNVDQNLVLLDEAPIYNASHMLGFFSAFNPDAIKDMQLYKGAISPRYGGRLSSVLDIRMKEGNSKEFSGNAGIGTIMSRLSLEAPIGDKGSFIVSGRRSYLDVVANTYTALRGVGDSDTTSTSSSDNKFYFYDLNTKGNYTLDENNRLMVSGYFGRDVFDFDGLGIQWGNQTSTIRWNHIFSPKLFSNLTLYYSNYDYFLETDDIDSRIKWDARLKEWSAKADFTSYLSTESKLQFGAQAILHNLNPGKINVFNNDTLQTEFSVDNNRSLENAVYVAGEVDVTEDLKVSGGLRVSSIHNIGPAVHYSENLIEGGLDSTKYGDGIYNSYYTLEPRLGLRYNFGSQSIKASYNRTAQYIQLASNGNSSTPFDIWFTASPNVKPQLADQIAVGFFKNFFNNTYEFSVETYYKNFSNSIDFKEGAQLLLNQNLEGELRSGKAEAYGVEFMIRKDRGKLTGWLGYTYAKARKQIESINNGNWYNAKYDKPHEVSVVMSYEFTNRFTLSSNFVYSTGSAVTFPTGRYEYGGVVLPYYSERNGERLPDYHRLDMSAIYKPKSKWFGGKVDAEWVFGIYNVYNRKNAYAINFRQEENRPNVTYAEKQAVFSIVPSVTLNAKF